MTNHTLLGTGFAPHAKHTSLGKLDEDTLLSTTWILEPNLSSEDENAVRSYCASHGLSVEKIHPDHLKVSGKASSFNTALSANLEKFSDTNAVFHAPISDLSIPASLKGKVHNVLGLNSRPVARPYFHLQKASRDLKPHASSAFTPLQLASLYNFPPGDGTGQKIGIIELGGGYVLSDLSTYFAMLNISSPINITAVSVDGGTNDPNDPSGASVEVVLDIEVIAAIAPKAALRVYFAPNTDAGFYDAFNMAINDGCSLVSCSWGGPEDSWSSTSLTSFNNLFATAANKAVTILVAAGDSGSSDGTSGNNVDFPGSSPYALSCGGTNVQADASISTITSETVWDDNPTSSATGGGISTVFAKPSYQNSVTYALNNHRGVPDVSGDADPNTGYVIYYQGSTGVVGGTSCVAPLWSGLLARINQNVGKNIGFLQPAIYANPNVCRDITQGSNGAYSAGPGWDPCSGWGSPKGVAIQSLFLTAPTPAPVSPPVASFTAVPLSGNAPLTVQFTDTSTNSPSSWSWSFGDGGTSTNQSPSHTYTSVGSFTAILTASNAGGSNASSHTITVAVAPPPPKPAPVASFTVSPSSGNAPLTVQFTDTSTNSPTSWSWTFGDGNNSTSKNPSHTYTAAGTYTATLTAINSSGSNSVSHAVTVSSPPQPPTPAPTPVPVASFTSNTTSGYAPLTVQFTDTSTNSPTSWSWTLSPGVTSTTKNPTHIYSTPGTFSVSLTATNAGGSNTITKSNLITVLAPPLPHAAFSFVGKVNQPVSFASNSAGIISSYLWRFGDGATSTAQLPTHTYTKAGLYTVVLTISNSSGSSSYTGYITIS